MEGDISPMKRGHFSCADRASLAGATYSAKVGPCYAAGLVADTEFASAV